MTIRVVTDSTCDLPAEVIAKYSISVVPLYINIGNRGYLDGVEISRAEFYNSLPTYAELPTTATPPPDKYRTAYETLRQQGATEILSIHISETLSGVLDSARMAAQETKAIPVTVFDSRQLSLGTGFLVETAGRLAQMGRSMSEILAALNEQVKRTYVFAALDTLKYLKAQRATERGGDRIGQPLTDQADHENARRQSRCGASGVRSSGRYNG